MVTPRGRVALSAGAAARWASRVTGRGAGAMIGGLVAMTLDRSILGQLGQGRRTVVITGTNGKSTTTRMTAAALATMGDVATNAEGANMDAGLVAALAAAPTASLAALEVDEMHVPHVSDAVSPAVLVLLNLSRDQLDRVGEINHIERTLRADYEKAQLSPSVTMRVTRGAARACDGPRLRRGPRCPARGSSGTLRRRDARHLEYGPSHDEGGPEPQHRRTFPRSR